MIVATSSDWKPTSRSDTNMYDATGSPVDSALFLGIPGPTIPVVRVQQPEKEHPKEAAARIARSANLSFKITPPPSTPR